MCSAMMCPARETNDSSFQCDCSSSQIAFAIPNGSGCFWARSSSPRIIRLSSNAAPLLIDCIKILSCLRTKKRARNPAHISQAKSNKSLLAWQIPVAVVAALALIPRRFSGRVMQAQNKIRSATAAARQRNAQDQR